jgi:radical SAM superfamily enzyme YgiQ (UPF0313 family)
VERISVLAGCIQKMKNAIILNDSGDEIIRRTMGAYKIADMMRTDGWTVEVIDWSTRWTNEELKQFIDSLPFEIDMVGVSNLWMQDHVIIEQISYLKSEYPNAKIVMGGPKPYQRDFGADAMVFGYSEHALKPVLEWLFDNGSMPQGKYPEWAPQSFLVDANHSYKGLSISKYHVDYHENDFIKNHEALTLEMSRGCRFKCKYCNYAFLGVKEDYSRSEESLYKELMDNYNRWGTTNYIISDDTFNDRDSKIEILANVVERLPFEPNFSCFIRIDLVISKPHQIDLLVRARCWAHFYGIETLHPLAAKAIGKGMHPDRIKKGLLWIKAEFMKRLGVYRGTTGMIAGLPYEPVESWHEGIKWMRDNWDSFFYWGLHISTDSDNTTQSDFSMDAGKYGYKLTENQEILDWATSKGFNNYITTGRQNNKLDNRVLVWESEWSNFRQATEFADEYIKNDFMKQKLFNFDLTEHMSKFDHKELIEFTAEEIYINRGLNGIYKKQIDAYKKQKLGLYA